jgi:hypothetical protein
MKILVEKEDEAPVVSDVGQPVADVASLNVLPDDTQQIFAVTRMTYYIFLFLLYTHTHVGGLS